jgi:hypothetical protein
MVMLDVLKQLVEVFDGDWTEESVDSKWAEKAMKTLDNAKKAIADLEKQDPFEYWNAVEGWVKVEREADQSNKQERNFCPRCGKRLGKNDWDIHTCTPPKE